MPIFYALTIGLLASLGINYLADILPLRKISAPPCRYCGKPMPFINYITLSTCKSCHTPRGWREISTVLIGMCISALLWIFPPAKFGYLLSLFLIAYLGLIIIIDIEHHLIMHIVTITGAFIGLGAGTMKHGLLSTVLGGVVGFVFMFIFYYFGILFAKWQAKKQGRESTDEEALGFGDVTLSGVLGLLMGVSNVMFGIVSGIILAGVFSILFLAILFLSKRFKSGSMYIPYGPFLILGSILYIFFR